ncbi:MlaD family protein [Mycobacterium sp. 050128]|uniref:MCE family protein n=1 Tax=Mycobacterium TaxID=1763 RepID=UPI0006CA6E7E|nr:MlaD family protein [Mycobacterium intracellulare]ARV80143.1 MCE family protein [Mycobacterium intracellulare subsp. chimaera]ASL18769.1 virulence factor Mce family protein [Mycobacterium intracellulare subsp. chimaera]KPN48879.1 mammalian cell entry protein [Mycobacterium intracellulare subsp. chimaera]KPN48987.1 mammalian cell entry protein [Mycobacterium intracellulare subsp. chimaera]MDM3909140.1 MlaD family protein [Mycobacterium intracellulare subsp. chimaera]
MHLSRRIRLQLAIFGVVTLLAGGLMAFGYLRLPGLLFGVGHYQVTISLHEAAGLYRNANVTYRGAQAGRVEDVRLSNSGVDAVLSLQSSVKIPADLDAQIHSQTAVGELFVELVPRTGDSPPLKNGDVISADRTSVPPDINTLLSALNTGLKAIPRDSLKTVIDESYTAFGGLGPELSRLTQGTTTLAIDARDNLPALTTLIDQSKPILDTQTDTSSSIQSWAAHVAQITAQLRDQDRAVRGILDTGPGAADEARQLLERVRPTLPIVLTNLVSLGQVAITYQPNLEQILALYPNEIEGLQGATLANRNTKQGYKGLFLSFNLNLNLPPPCRTGYLPAQQQRAPGELDYPDKPPGDLYCRIPQDSSLTNVRGARNLPCETRPGKRAPTVKMCESDENYVPLNDGYNWKGDPNATLSGQPVPQLPPGTSPALLAPAAPPIAIAQYDPSNGTYIGPDGQQYTQANLGQDATTGQAWQDMLLPPKGH